jgi:hypothetical protein
VAEEVVEEVVETLRQALMLVPTEQSPCQRIQLAHQGHLVMIQTVPSPPSVGVKSMDQLAEQYRVDLATAQLFQIYNKEPTLIDYRLPITMAQLILMI